MGNLLGEFDCKLDSKSRIALPSALRKKLSPEANGRFVINRGFERHLVIYPSNAWEIITAEINRLNLYVKKNREFVRYFYRGATELALDNSGRLLLPRRLLAYAAIKENAILLAYANRIECWDAELYSKLLYDEPEDFAKLAEEIMGNIQPGSEKELPLYPELPPFAPRQQH